MHTPPELAARVLKTFGKPEPVRAEFATGGLLHRLLRVELGDGRAFALKLFSPRSTTTPADREQLELAETVAAIACDAGVPSLVALRHTDGAYLQSVGDQWCALYPWIEGETLPPTAAAPPRCAIMGQHLARLHALKIRFPHQKAPIPEAFPEGHFRQIEQRAREKSLGWASRLTQSIEEIEIINAVAGEAQTRLTEGWVTGHLDFDQKNVLWQGESPIILDWESVKPIHPALEAMGAGLSWAGQSAGEPQCESFLAFLHGYLSLNPLEMNDLKLAIDAVLGKWIIWLEFNLQRLLDDKLAGTSEHDIALGAGMHALEATLKLNADRPLYRGWLEQLKTY